MGTLTEAERRAVAATAAWASAAWEEGPCEGPAARLSAEGRRIALEVATVRPATPAVKPQLRFDRVVARLLRGLEAALTELVPPRAAVIVAVTAPIRLPARTEHAITARVAERIAGPAVGDIVETIHGNGVRVRLVGHVPGPTPALVGFVHNPVTDAGLLCDLAESLLRRVGAVAARPARDGDGGRRWLVLADDGGGPLLDTYRHVVAALPAAAAFQRVLIALEGGRVEVLA